MAPQFTATKAPLRRGLDSWMARATTSLPVPDSPSTSTLESCCATFRIKALTTRIAADGPLGKRTDAAPPADNAARVATDGPRSVDGLKNPSPESWRELYSAPGHTDPDSYFRTGGKKPPKGAPASAGSSPTGDLSPMLAEHEPLQRIEFGGGESVEHHGCRPALLARHRPCGQPQGLREPMPQMQL